LAEAGGEEGGERRVGGEGKAMARPAKL